MLNSEWKIKTYRKQYPIENSSTPDGISIDIFAKWVVDGHCSVACVRIHVWQQSAWYRAWTVGAVRASTNVAALPVSKGTTARWLHLDVWPSDTCASALVDTEPALAKTAASAMRAGTESYAIEVWRTSAKLYTTPDVIDYSL